MADYSFSFNGVASSTFGLIVSDRRWGMCGDIDNSLQRVPGRDGAYLSDEYHGHRTVTFSVGFDHDSFTDAQSKMHALAAWLKTSSAKQLIMADDPGVAYNAKLDGNLLPQEWQTFSEGDLTFIIPDPYAYSPSESVTTLSLGTTPVINSGGVEAFPRYEVTLGGDTNAVRISAASSYIQVGQPADDTQTPVDPTPLSFTDDMADMDGWSPGACSDFGRVAGSFDTNGSSISPKYGTGGFGDPTEDWHGPTLGRDLTSNLTDFHVHAWIGMDNTGRADAHPHPSIGMARIEVYLLDVADNVIGKMQLRDSWSSMAKAEAAFFAGPLASRHTLMVTTGPKETSLNDFYGRLSIGRVGNVWAAYVAKCDPTSRVVKWSKMASKWKDKTGAFGADLHRIEIRIAKYHDHLSTTTCLFDEVSVTGAATVPEDSPVLIGAAGDVLAIDTYSSLVRKNGEPFMSAVDFGSTFFPIGSGATDVLLDVDGPAPVSATAYVRERWL